MDFIKNAMGSSENNQQGQPTQSTQQKEGGGGFMGGLGEKFNSAAGGGKESIDAVQQYGFGQGDQSNESAVEQAKDEQISDAIRRQYKSTTGSDIPIKDKETRFG